MNKEMSPFFDSEAISRICDRACYLTQEISSLKIILFSIIGGAFITFGALFSIMLTAQIETLGYVRLLEGFGYSAGFFFVLASQSILFTEANVLMPLSLLNCSVATLIKGVLRLWIIAFIGNFIGAFIVGHWITFTQHYPEKSLATLDAAIKMKMQYKAIGSVSAFFQIILSGMLANWLVGLAVIFSEMNKTVAAKFIPILLAVSVFVTSNFQHSPANMGYFSLYIPLHHNISWHDAIFWNLIPAGIGNLIGGTFLVALPFWYSLNLPIKKRKKWQVHKK